MSKLFAVGFFGLAAIAIAMMALGMCESPTAGVPEQLSVEEQNVLLSQVEFSISGAPAGETALFLDDTLISRLTLGQTERLSLTGNNRCGVSLKVRDAEGGWVHVASLGCINHAKYAALSFTLDGFTAEVSRGAWRE